MICHYVLLLFTWGMPHFYHFGISTKNVTEIAKPYASLLYIDK